MGLENKINESKAKIYNLDYEIANKQFILLLHPLIGPTLSRLIQNGMGMEDIIGINNQIQSCKENTFSFESDHEIDRKSSNSNSNSAYCLTPLTGE